MLQLLRFLYLWLALGSIVFQGCSLVVESTLDDLDDKESLDGGGDADDELDTGAGADGDANRDAETGVDGAAETGTDAKIDATTTEGCDELVCGTHQHCVEESGEGRCECDEGYAGEDCGDCASGYQDNDDDGECMLNCDTADLSCGKREMCVDDSGEARCECEPGYTGEECDECAPGYQDNDDDSVCEPNCDTADPSCDTHAHCEDGSGEARCVCDEGYEGDDCSSCVDGYQDNDDNGSCEPACATAEVDCSGHGNCDDSSGSLICVCQPSYTGDDCELCTVGFEMQNGACEWVGVVDNGTFSDDTGWVVDGSAVIQTGWADFSMNASCIGGNIAQRVPMPAFYDSGRLVLRFEVLKTSAANDPFIGVGIDGLWKGVPVDAANVWEQKVICLGDRLYGDPMDIEFGRYARPSICSNGSTDIASFRIDNVVIEPAAQDQCIEPGTIANGDFEQGDDGAWVPVEGSVDPSFQSAEVAAGNLMNGDYYGYLGISNRCGSSSLIGRMFTPETDSLSNSAIELVVNGTGSRPLIFSIGSATIGQVLNTGSTNKVIRFCLPEWSRGRALRPKFELPIPLWGVGCGADVTDFYIDDLTFVSEPQCPDGENIVDGGFEFDTSVVVSPWRFEKYDNNSSDANIDIQVLNDPALSHSGNNVLRLQATEGCTHVHAFSTVFVPHPQSDSAGPAIKLYYKLLSPETSYGEYRLCFRMPGLGMYYSEIVCHLFEPSAEYTEASFCIDPSLAGRVLEIEFEADGSRTGSGIGCGMTFAVEQFYIDDVILTTDDNCPP